jgi:septum site-determining protein MinC
MVTLKGTKEGLLISLGDGDWTEVLSELIAKLERPRAAGFFRGAYARVEPDGWTLTDSQSNELASILDSHGMHLDRRKYVGLPVQVPSQSTRVVEPDAVEPEDQGPAHGEQGTTGENEQTVTDSDGSSFDGNEHELWSEAAIVRRTVRSGQSIRYPGHVVVYGDVNPGGEIVAGGDVIVWGKLNGVVHAGATGDENAIVGALQLAAMQLRIGNYIARAPDNRTQKAQGVEVARVRNGRIVIENWTSRKDWEQSQDWLQSLLSSRGLRRFRR